MIGAALRSALAAIKRVAGGGAISWLFDPSAASYDNKILYYASQEVAGRSVYISADGSSFYVIGSGSKKVNQYALSTALDVSTAVFSGASPSLLEDSSISDFYIKPDGLKMYVLGGSADVVMPYTLATAWDVTTATYDGSPFSVSAQETNPHGMCFSIDGLNLYVIGEGTDRVYQYSLATAWDLSTASYVASYAVPGILVNSRGVRFSPLGDVMYLLNRNDNSVSVHPLSVPWSLSSASYNSATVGVAASPYGFCFSFNGEKMYVLRTSGYEIHQYSGF